MEYVFAAVIVLMFANQLKHLIGRALGTTDKIFDAIDSQLAELSNDNNGKEKESGKS